jgi:dTDP-4-dehydrorhamnose reductase
MKHVIFGAGNLGLDLRHEIVAQHAGTAYLFSRREGYDVTDLGALEMLIVGLDPQVIWYCVGGGSVPDCKPGNPNYARSRLLNAEIPLVIAKMARRQAKLIVFSTDYSADETDPSNPLKINPRIKSEYSAQKVEMEKKFLNYPQRPGTTVVRVGSLYGAHKPDKTFPGKILKSFGHNTAPISLPNNLVTPTPTRWVASELVRNLSSLAPPDRLTVEHVAPEGNVSVRQWGKMVLDGLRNDRDFVDSHYVDHERPAISALGCTLPTTVPTWRDLWGVYYDPAWYSPNRNGGPPKLKLV